MAFYIKANPKVVNFLHLANDRNMVKDGNYILWLQDMLPFGPLPRLAETLERIGAITLMPHEAREEQFGITLRPLPTATDPDFVMDEAEDENGVSDEPQGEESETPTEETAGGESESTDTGEGTDEAEAPAENSESDPEGQATDENEAGDEPTGESEENDNPNNEEE